jgi:hypothetical protein
LRGKSPVASGLVLLSMAAALASIGGLVLARRWFKVGGISSWSDGTVAKGRIVGPEGELFDARGMTDGPVLYRASLRVEQAYRGPLRAVEEALPGAWFEVKQVYERWLGAARVAAIITIVAAATSAVIR